LAVKSNADDFAWEQHNLKIHRATLSTCSQARGVVVVIDVLRAFTTVACLFGHGVKRIILVSGVEEAFRLRDENPAFLLLGEVDGIQVEGFDLGNSPSKLDGMELNGKTVIQRTTTGTQGVVLARNAEVILAAALTNVTATVRLIQKIDPAELTLLQTGYFPEKGWGDEDVACADVLEHLLLGRRVDWPEIFRRVRASRSGLHYDGTMTHYPPRDLEMALQVDAYNFGMRVEKKEGLHLLQKVEIELTD
jgi:2-phosphosulfolactate phosphatase